jgi:hypothetical protein
MHRPRGGGGAGDEPGRRPPVIGGGHRPGGELFPHASTSVTDGDTVGKPS